jgi:hypothetical protein
MKLSSPSPVLPTAKVRRLYDIANVLTTLGLIRKKTFLAPNHRKMPGYSWAGPSIDQIQEICECFWVGLAWIVRCRLRLARVRYNGYRLDSMQDVDPMAPKAACG